MQNSSSSLSSILHEIYIYLKELESLGAFYVLMITTSFHAESTGPGRYSENTGTQHWEVVIFIFWSDSSSDIRERQSEPEVNVLLSAQAHLLTQVASQLLVCLQGNQWLADLDTAGNPVREQRSQVQRY